MLIEGLAVVGADINVDAHDFAGGLPRIQTFHDIQKAEYGSGQNKRAAVGNDGFQDEIRFYLRNDLLESDDVLWILNNWPCEPRKVVGVLELMAPSKELFCRVGNAGIECLSIGALNRLFKVRPNWLSAYEKVDEIL